MDERKFLPNTDQLGVLTATVLLAFALSHLIRAPEFNVEIQLPGFYFGNNHLNNLLLRNN